MKLAISYAVFLAAAAAFVNGQERIPNISCLQLELDGFCCGNIPYKVYSGNIKYDCCGGRVYAISQNVCCNGHLYPKPRYNKCCESTPYNSNDGYCCFGQYLNGSKDSSDVCCGTSYDENKTCCNATRYDPLPNFACCWDRHFNISTHWCHRHKGLLPLGFDYCGETKYDIRSDFCCDSNLLHNVTGNRMNLDCCGTTQTYDILNERCCPAHQTIIDITKSCCGNDLEGVDQNTELCCDNVKFAKQTTSDRCCGKRPYSSDTHGCCKDEIFSRSEKKMCGRDSTQCTVVRNQEQCCGDKELPVNSVCCEAGSNSKEYFVRETTNPNNNKCCASFSKYSKAYKLYDGETQICIPGEEPMVVDLPRPMCGGHTPYDEQLDLCCDSVLHFGQATDINKICCGQQVYDSRNQSCCGDNTVVNFLRCPDRSRGDHEDLVCEWICGAKINEIKRDIRDGIIDVCQHKYAYKVNVKRETVGRNQEMFALRGGSNNLFKSMHQHVAVNRVFLPCSCPQRKKNQQRRSLIIMTDKSIKQRSVTLSEEDNDVILPHTRSIKKLLQNERKRKCKNTESVVTVEMIDDIFDFIKYKIIKEKGSAF